jgi:hypothetical protein
MTPVRRILLLLVAVAERRREKEEKQNHFHFYKDYIQIHLFALVLPPLRYKE